MRLIGVFVGVIFITNNRERGFRIRPVFISADMLTPTMEQAALKSEMQVMVAMMMPTIRVY